ncbi:hypothetical protein ASPWEDRAFT_28482 [Aspergillus wentii DTO 134E9]|uniref:Uncharacterized protein n=1 Tax=Aspergillus wentii DTO 134E9 TaxID=1073089 RepID=A0A1L9RLT4_ASPWE|nr:uncharacterized protein ASPWEDRAFT_28482 [Aspergillus wentii DTO 134E9]OJJ35882.1 hypothetical protein ASPWEDRAFT_28482 [Aspergillus wentii DTO 134E9]
MASAQYPIVFIAIVLVAMLDLLQTAHAQEDATNNTLPMDILQSAPIIPVDTADASAVVQPSNSSLVATRPDIAAPPPSNITSLPQASELPHPGDDDDDSDDGDDGDNSLGRRQQCQGGPLASPIALWTNVKILADRVCEVWFPNNQVFYVKAPLPPPGAISVRIPVPNNPTFNFKYITRGSPPIADLVTPLTSKICKDRYDAILAFAANQANFGCTNPPNVHDGDDCNNGTHSACFSFLLS